MHKRERRTRDKRAEIAPIGLIHTPFKHSDGTPIQGVAGKGAEGVVELLPDLIEGLRDLEGFDRLWLIYEFDRASEVQLVVRPYLDTTERGVFATRSPVRPNHIGISVVRLYKSTRTVCMSLTWICWTELHCSTSNHTFPLSIPSSNLVLVG